MQSPQVPSAVVPSKHPLVHLVMHRDLIRQIDAYWHRHQLKSRSAAIKHLIRWALEQDAPPPPAEDDEDE